MKFQSVTCLLLSLCLTATAYAKIDLMTKNEDPIQAKTAFCFMKTQDLIEGGKDLASKKICYQITKKAAQTSAGHSYEGTQFQQLTLSQLAKSPSDESAFLVRLDYKALGSGMLAAEVDGSLILFGKIEAQNQADGKIFWKVTLEDYANTSLTGEMNHSSAFSKWGEELEGTLQSWISEKLQPLVEAYLNSDLSSEDQQEALPALP